MMSCDQLLNAQTHTHMHAHTLAHTQIHAQTHTCMHTLAHTHTHTCIHAHIHTHIHTPPPPPPHLKVQQSIGYCPQFDALLDRLTGREHLTLFARLRGIPEAHIKGVVDRQVERLDLSKHVDRCCGTYRYARIGGGGGEKVVSIATFLKGGSSPVNVVAGTREN